MIAIGTNTDPYQPIEREYKIMRGILEVLERAGIRSASSPSRRW
jgi:DNA repair photolyase